MFSRCGDALEGVHSVSSAGQLGRSGVHDQQVRRAVRTGPVPQDDQQRSVRERGPPAPDSAWLPQQGRARRLPAGLRCRDEGRDESAPGVHAEDRGRRRGRLHQLVLLRAVRGIHQQNFSLAPFSKYR